MEKKQLVLARLQLKPRVKSLGFNKKELMGVAASIADNLTADDEASDEDVNAEIDKAIDAVIPILALAQTQASRLMDSYKKKHESGEDDDDDEGDDVNQNHKKNQKHPKPTEKDDAQNGLMEQLKTLTGLVTKMQEEIVSFKGEKVADLRKQKLETLLKDTGVFGTRTMKNFAKMSFSNDEEFDEYYSDVESDLRDYNQERANAGLSSLGSLPGAKGTPKKEEPFSDDEIAALAN